MAYESGLQADAADPACKKGLAEVQRAMDDSPENPFGGAGNGGGMDMGLGKIFNDPGLIGKLQANPKTRDAMRDPAFMAKIQGLQRGGGAMGADMLSDPRMLTVLGVAMGVDIVSRPFQLSMAPSSLEPAADTLGRDGTTRRIRRDATRRQGPAFLLYLPALLRALLLHPQAQSGAGGGSASRRGRRDGR